MVGGATPPEDGSALVLSLRRMNRIPSIDSENRIAIAEAGVILAILHEAAHEIGMRFPLTLGARGSCTVGGLTSTNAGGTQVLKFGTMRALIAGVEAVLPDGFVHANFAFLAGFTGFGRHRDFTIEPRFAVPVADHPVELVVGRKRGGHRGGAFRRFQCGPLSCAFRDEPVAPLVDFRCARRSRQDRRDRRSRKCR